MKCNKTQFIFLSGFFLFLIDRYFKYQALHGWSASKLIGWFGWQPFFNPGVAFGLRVPGVVIIIISLVIILLLLYLLFLHVSRSTYHISANVSSIGQMLRVTCYVLILAGAASNLVDRLTYGYTVDYLRIYTSMINLADVMIVVGFVVYLLCKSKTQNFKS